MTLAAGSRLGPYEILGLIGAGGMGEVYRARDPRLGREVAIKVLPASFSADPDRLRRFEQEAKAAGVLNHPNITAVYDIGQHDGATYVVQELLEGETLRAALAGGGLPPRTAIDYASQIAEGLAAAHAKGIVHRDLKPENVFVAVEGRVKILDFGLAKLTQPDGGPGRDTGLPTATPGTEPGIVMGTLGYMSPEQVRGRPTDARSDIFALGAVLYEMLSGRRAFQGDSAADTMSAILKEDPPDLSATNRSISPGLERIVRHCLEKNPEQRFQSARDMVFHLQSITADTGSAALAALPGPAPKRRWGVPALAGAGAALALSAAATLILRPPSPPGPPVSRFSIRAPEGVSLAELGTQSLPSISPDGRRMAFTATDSTGNTSIWVRSFSDIEPRRIVEATDAVGQVGWSPDGRQLAYFARSGNLLLKKMPADGGPATAITDAGPRGAGVGVTWGPEGTILFGVWAPEAGIFRVSEGGGTPVPVVKADASRGELLVASPILLPGGRHFLYVARNRDAEKSGLYVRALDGKDARRLTAAESQGQYVDPGYLLFMRQRTLFAQRFDLGRLTLEGAPVALAQGVWRTPQTWRGGFSGVKDVLVYSPVRPPQSKLLWHDRAGSVLGEVPAPDGAQSPEFSPSGDRLLVDRREPTSGNSDIWLLDPSRGTATRFTFDPGEDLNGVWSPDGASVYFYSNRSGRLSAIYRKPSTATSPRRRSRTRRVFRPA